MDFEDQKTAEPVVVYKPEKKHRGWKIFWAIITVLSILCNIFLFLMLIALFALFGPVRRDFFIEEIVREGPPEQKIVVVDLQGIIDGKTYTEIYKQLRTAGADEKVKGVIIRVNSPGGMASASDRIYNEIGKFREQTGKPVVAFMQNIAASGGYYTSAGCDKIVAEPTTITGSIGVIMTYFVFQELLEGKLGIEPVVVKSGLKKDWPSMFEPPSEEQLEYFDEKLIKPVYERFVGIVADSRAELTIDDVKRLADGSIYSAKEAYDEKLIDEIGYLDKAIEQVLSLAGIKEAEVVEYHRPFSLAYLLEARANDGLKIDRSTLHNLSTPEVMYLWSIH